LGFIDWAPIDKEGEVSFQQLLLARSLEAVAISADLAGDQAYAVKCRQLSSKPGKKSSMSSGTIVKMLLSIIGKMVFCGRGHPLRQHVRCFVDYVDDEKKQMIKDNVI
jgi:hypothetical protein